MSGLKVPYIVQSCPKCGKQLLKVQAGTKMIGSPLITCKKCNITYRTDLRVDWYKYEHKWSLWIAPLLIPLILLLVGTILEDFAIGIMAALFGLLFSFFLCGKELLRVVQSKKRMKNRDYLQKLLSFGAISTEEYLRLMREAKLSLHEGGADPMYGSGNWGIEVFLAMSEEQAKRQGRYRCMQDTLPGSGDLYEMLDEIPASMCVSKTIGWQKEICMTKENFLLLAQQWNLLLLPSYLAFIDSVDGDHIWLIGFGG